MTHQYWTAALGLALAATAVQAPGAMGENLIYVPVAPCRIVNTLGSIDGALQPDVARNLLAWGSAVELAAQGGTADCLHPKQTEGLQPVAIAANVTAVGKRASGNGNIVAYPAGGSDPGASLVNFTTAANIANATVIKLCDPADCPAEGDFALEANFATVPAIVDVQGYFYPKELHHVVTVSAAGGDFTGPLEAMAALAQLVADNDADKPGLDNPYLIHIGPGIYELGSERLQLLPGVTLIGAGRDVTVLHGAGSAGSTDAIVRGADGATLRNLTIEGSGGSFAIALYNNGTAPTLDDVALAADGAGTGIGLLNAGAGAKPALTGVTIAVAGNTSNTAIKNQNGAAPILTDVAIATDGSPNRGVDNSGASSATLYHSTVSGDLNNDATSGVWFATGVLDGSAAGGGFTCAFVVGGDFVPLDASCQPQGE